MKLTIAATAMLLSASTALAASVHFSPPTDVGDFTDNGLSLNLLGKIAGLGNATVVINMSATGNTTAICTNGGGNTVSAQAPPTTVTGSEIIPATEIKNGQVVYSVTTQAPANPIPGAPGCPNPNWTETITGVAFTSAAVTVDQPPGTFVLGASCTFNPGTQNGQVPAGEVSCKIQQ